MLHIPVSTCMCTHMHTLTPKYTQLSPCVHTHAPWLHVHIPVSTCAHTHAPWLLTSTHAAQGRTFLQAQVSWMEPAGTVRWWVVLPTSIYLWQLLFITKDITFLEKKVSPQYFTSLAIFFFKTTPSAHVFHMQPENYLSYWCPFDFIQAVC